MKLIIVYDFYQGTYYVFIEDLIEIFPTILYIYKKLVNEFLLLIDLSYLNIICEYKYPSMVEILRVFDKVIPSLSNTAKCKECQYRENLFINFQQYFLERQLTLIVKRGEENAHFLSYTLVNLQLLFNTKVLCMHFQYTNKMIDIKLHFQNI